MSKSATAEIEIDVVERQALALVNGQGPGQAKRKLAKGAGDRLDDFFLRLVIGVTPAFPGHLFDLVHGTIDLYKDALIRQRRHEGNRAVDPASLRVVAQQHNLVQLFEQ